MAGNLKTKERSAITLTSTGSSLTNGSAGSAGTDLDCRSSGGTGNAEGDLDCRFELLCQWATITGIAKGTVVAELYLVPKLDGTNLPDVDTTSGSSALPFESYATQFTAIKAPSPNTNMRFVSNVVSLRPELYTAYLLDRSGQTITANWTLKALPAQAQYT
jgi:hypothetical protein